MFPLVQLPQKFKGFDLWNTRETFMKFPLVQLPQKFKAQHRHITRFDQLNNCFHQFNFRRSSKDGREKRYDDHLLFPLVQLPQKFKAYQHPRDQIELNCFHQFNFRRSSKHSFYQHLILKRVSISSTSAEVQSRISFVHDIVHPFPLVQLPQKFKVFGKVVDDSKTKVFPLVQLPQKFKAARRCE